MMIKDRYNIKLDSLINLRKKGYINGFALIKGKQIRTKKVINGICDSFDETELELVIMQIFTNIQNY